jgi:hypothetical protein
MIGIIDDASTFLSSYIGILIQVTVFIAALVPGVKFLSKKFDERTDARIDAKLGPLAQSICNQLTQVENALKTQREVTATTIEALQKSQEFLQELIVKK